MNEAETRAERVDPALAAAGWGVVPGSRILREYHIAPGRIEGPGRRATPLIADYVLVHRNRKLAVVEAKAADKPLTEGVGQATTLAGGRLRIINAEKNDLFDVLAYVAYALPPETRAERAERAKLAPLLKLRYHDSIADALADLGDATLIGRIFAGFQKYLYQPSAA